MTSVDLLRVRLIDLLNSYTEFTEEVPESVCVSFHGAVKDDESNVYPVVTTAFSFKDIQDLLK